MPQVAHHYMPQFFLYLSPLLPTLGGYEGTVLTSDLQSDSHSERAYDQIYDVL